MVSLSEISRFLLFLIGLAATVMLLFEKSEFLSSFQSGSSPGGAEEGFWKFYEENPFRAHLLLVGSLFFPRLTILFSYLLDNQDFSSFFLTNSPSLAFWSATVCFPYGQIGYFAWRLRRSHPYLISAYVPSLIMSAFHEFHDAFLSSNPNQLNASFLKGVIVIWIEIAFWMLLTPRLSRALCWIVITIVIALDLFAWLTLGFLISCVIAFVLAHFIQTMSAQFGRFFSYFSSRMANFGRFLWAVSVRVLSRRSPSCHEGFNPDLFSDRALANQYLCPICLFVVDDPVVCLFAPLPYLLFSFCSFLCLRFLFSSILSLHTPPHFHILCIHLTLVVLFCVLPWCGV